MHLKPWAHRHHLGRPIRLDHWAWSSIYSIWFANRRPTIVDRCRYMSVSTGSASASRGRVPPLLYALPRSSLGLRSHGLETGPMPRQGRSLQNSPVRWMNHIWTRMWLTSSVSWEGAEPHDQGLRTFNSIVIYIITFSYCFCCDLTLLLSVIVFVSTVIWHYDSQLFCHCFSLRLIIAFFPFTLRFDVGRPCVPSFARLFRKEKYTYIYIYIYMYIYIYVIADINFVKK